MAERTRSIFTTKLIGWKEAFETTFIASSMDEDALAVTGAG